MMHTLQKAAEVKMPFKVPDVCDAKASGHWYVWKYAQSVDARFKAVSIGNLVFFIYVCDTCEVYFVELTLKLPFYDDCIIDMAVSSHQFAVLLKDSTVHIWTQDNNKWVKEPVTGQFKDGESIEWCGDRLHLKRRNSLIHAFTRRRCRLLFPGHCWDPMPVRAFVLPEEPPVQTTQQELAEA